MRAKAPRELLRLEERTVARRSSESGSRYPPHLARRVHFKIWVWLKIQEEGQTAGVGPLRRWPGPEGRADLPARSAPAPEASASMGAKSRVG